MLCENKACSYQKCHGPANQHKGHFRFDLAMPYVAICCHNDKGIPSTFICM